MVLSRMCKSRVQPTPQKGQVVRVIWSGWNMAASSQRLRRRSKRV